MLFVLWFKWNPENTSKLIELWKEFKYPEEAILKITYPFRDIGVPHIAPALPLDEALEIMQKM